MYMCKTHSFFRKNCFYAGQTARDGIGMHVFLKFIFFTDTRLRCQVSATMDTFLGYWKLQ